MEASQAASGEPVLLILPDGSVEIYEGVVTRAQVLSEFPGHLLVCKTRASSKVFLQPGATYTLVPKPGAPRAAAPAGKPAAAPTRCSSAPTSWEPATGVTLGSLEKRPHFEPSQMPALEDWETASCRSSAADSSFSGFDSGYTSSRRSDSIVSNLSIASGDSNSSCACSDANLQRSSTHPHSNQPTQLPPRVGPKDGVQAQGGMKSFFKLPSAGILRSASLQRK